MSHKTEILKTKQQGTTIRNSMGCNENWYNPYYAIQQVFSEEEILSMTDTEVDNLVRLADAISEALY